jgi:hypothetical protein
MGLVGGLITLPINALFSWLLKKEEINLQYKIKQREMKLQAQIDYEAEKKKRSFQTRLDFELEREKRKLDNALNPSKEISEIISRIEKIENTIRGLSSNGN